MAEYCMSPTAATDIGCWFYWEKNGRNIYVVGSKSVDKYFSITEDMCGIVLDAVKMMDGNHTAGQIKENISEKYGADFDVEGLISKLKNAGLLMNEKELVSNELDLFAKKLLNIEFREIKSSTRKGLTIVWNLLFLVSLMTIVLTLGIGIRKPEEVVSFVGKCMTYKDSYLYGAIIAMLISIFNIVVHECSHMLTSVKCGLQPSSFCVFLYGSFKMLWAVKIKGLYTVRRKYRVMIMSAGVFSNLIIICLAVLMGINHNFGLISTDFTSKLVMSNFFMIIACCTPFNISDGYYVMSQLAKKNNIRRHMFRLLNFSSGEYKKANIGNILYTVVSLLLIFLSLYASTVWTFRISGELFHKVGIASNAVFGTFAAAIPVAFLGWFDFIFARRFVILVKNNK